MSLETWENDDMNNQRTEARWIGSEEPRLERLTGEHETAGMLIDTHERQIHLDDTGDGLPSALGTFGTLQNERESEIFSRIAEAALAQPSRYQRPTLLRKILFVMGF